MITLLYIKTPLERMVYYIISSLIIWYNVAKHVFIWYQVPVPHYNDVIMSAMGSQITGLTFVYSTVYSGTYERKHQSSASLAFVRGIHRGPVNSLHKGSVTLKMFPLDDVIMIITTIFSWIWIDIIMIIALSRVVVSSLYCVFPNWKRIPVAYFTKEVKPTLAKPPLNFNGGLAKFGLTSSAK